MDDDEEDEPFIPAVIPLIGNNNTLIDQMIENQTQYFNWFTAERILRHLPRCDRNHAISSIYVFSSFTILYFGQNETKNAEMLNFLGLHRGHEKKVFAALHDILLTFAFEGMKLRPNYQIFHIFRLLIDERVALSPHFPKFKTSVKRYFNLEIDKINFEEDCHLIGPQIRQLNKLELKTQNISSFRTRIDKKTKLVILTAVRFKSDWDVLIPLNRIKDDNFYTENGVKTVQMMSIFNQELKFRYWHKLDSQIVEIPFARQSLSFILIVPQKVDGMNTLLNGLNYETLHSVIADLYTHRCDVFLPKFKVECDYDFARFNFDLKVFKTDEALFNAGEGLRIKANNVLHKVLFEIDEKGVNPPNTSINTRLMHRTVRADRPFLFIVKDNRTLAWVFIGQVHSP